MPLAGALRFRMLAAHAFRVRVLEIRAFSAPVFNAVTEAIEKTIHCVLGGTEGRGRAVRLHTAVENLPLGLLPLPAAALWALRRLQHERVCFWGR